MSHSTNPEYHATTSDLAISTAMSEAKGSQALARSVQKVRHLADGTGGGAKNAMDRSGGGGPDVKRGKSCGHDGSRGGGSGGFVPAESGLVLSSSSSSMSSHDDSTVSSLQHHPADADSCVASAVSDLGSRLSTGDSPPSSYKWGSLDNVEVSLSIRIFLPMNGFGSIGTFCL